MPSPLRRFAALLLLTACTVGTTGRNYAPAKGPAGASVTLGLSGNREIGGELLAVEGAGLLLLENRQLIRVDFGAIKSLRVPKISTRDLDQTMRERLRLISRYPQGVSPELEERLLQAYGAASVREVS
jgi:hypothetical protein